MPYSPSNIRWSQGVTRLLQPIRSFYRELLTELRELLVLLGRGDVGRWGERKALDYVRTRGLHPIEINWRTDKYEADILALDGRTLVIVEVKTRQKKHQSSYPAIDAVDREKCDALRKLARRFQRRKAPMLRRLYVQESRIDVVEVYYKAHQLLGLVVVEILYHRGTEPFAQAPSTDKSKRSEKSR